MVSLFAFKSSSYAICPIFLMTATFSCLATMAPRVDLAALKVMKATAAARVAKKTKKRPAVEAGQYEQKSLRNGLRIESVGHETA